MNIAVMGTGYVGLVTGTCFADSGNTVTCVDVDASKVATLNEGVPTIYEEGLAPMLQRNLDAGRLRFTTDAAEAIAASEIVYIAVGTPQDTDGSADLRYVLQVAETIGEHMNGHRTVVCKSTVPVGTCDRVRETIEALSDHPVDVVSNPEFMKEGTAIDDFCEPDRVVIGAENPDAAETIASLYRPFVDGDESRLLCMGVRSAEMTKYASNSLLAAKISFINEIANLCDRLGADVEDVRQGMSLDRRIGPHFIYPGCGYGGSCFPKDVRALARLGDEADYDARMLKTIDETNQRQKSRLLEDASDYYGNVRGKRFAVWGLAFKPGTDDLREAPSLLAIRHLVAEGATVVAHDPIAMPNARRELADLVEAGAVRFADDPYAAVDDTDGLFVFTEWDVYRDADLGQVARRMDSPAVFDGRNIFDLDEAHAHRLSYRSIGRPAVEPAQRGGAIAAE